MIVTVTLNAAWDRTYFVETLRPGRAHSVTEVRGSPGGKGINVARAFQALGGRPLATGLAGGLTGRAVTAGLAAEGIENSFVIIGGESRNTVAVVDRRSGDVTEFREPGAPVTGEDLETFVAHLHSLLSGASFCVISGSLPPGAPPDFPARLIRLAREAGVRTVLDTSGPALAAGVAAGPTLVKPNYEEALALDPGPAPGRPTPQRPLAERLAMAARVAARLPGPETVVVSLGEEGALLGHGGRLWHGAVRLERVVNAVGSGDAMVAGLVLAFERGDEPAEALRLGVAAGAANALTETAGHLRPEDVAGLLPRVRLMELPPGSLPELPLGGGSGTGVEARN